VAIDTEARVDFSNGSEDGGATRFSVATHMPAGARTLQLVSSAGAILAERSAGAAVPAVRVVAPADGDTWTPGDPVRWEADDAGGRGLRFSAYYSRNGGAEWTPLAVGVAADSLVLAGLTPGPDPVLVVAATDGFNVTTDTASFRVRVEPTPLGHSPGAGDTVSVGAGVQVYFNTDLTSEAAAGGALLLMDGAGQLVEGETRYDDQARALRFEPARPLAAGTEYTAFLPSGLGDRFGNRAGSDYTWRFVVEPDTESPRVERAAPREDAIAIPLNTVIQVRFSEAMDPESVSGLRVVGPDGREVPGTVSYEPETRTAVFVPRDLLEAASTYRVTVPAEASDRSGNGLAAEYGWTFTTTGAAPPDPSR